MKGIKLATVLMGIALLSGCGAKYETDKQMQILCAKDGGMRVYETVKLPASEFSQWGQPLDRYWSGRTNPEEKLGPNYRYVSSIEFLKRGDTLKAEVQINKAITKVFRRSDGKLLGEAVSYGRSGGDPYIALLLGGHPSSFSCGSGANELLRNLFIQGE